MLKGEEGKLYDIMVSLLHVNNTKMAKVCMSGTAKAWAYGQLGIHSQAC